MHIHNGGHQPSLSPRHQLPPLPSHFIGRSDVYKELVSLLTAGRHIALFGTGGVGKSALAAVLVHHLKDHYPDAQIHINLRGAGANKTGGYQTGIAKPLTAVEAIRNIIHVFQPEAKLPDALDELESCYRSVLSSLVGRDGQGHPQRILLFLDNALDADQILPLLPPPNCLLIVTSRQRLHLDDLQEFEIGLLTPAKSEELLRTIGPRLKGHEPVAAELCGYLPLALRAIASLAKAESLTNIPEILADLRERRKKLGPVDAAFQVSYELLSEKLRRQWSCLAVFPASFDLPAAAAVWETNTEVARVAMQSLVNASLVEWNEANKRFRLHDLIRQFCDNKLTSEERMAAKFRHAIHYRDAGAYAYQLSLENTDGNLARGLALFDLERTHLEAAFAFLSDKLGLAGSSNREQSGAMRATDIESATLLVSLVNAVAFADDLRFHPHQRIYWLENQRITAHISKDRAAEGCALGNLGNAYFDLGDARKAIEFHGQALVIDREIGDRRAEGQDLGNLGNAYAALGDARKAIIFQEQALIVIREIGDERAEGSILGNLGNAYFDLGDARKAVEFQEQRLEIAREIGDRRGEGNALGNLGNAYLALGDPRKAVEFYEQHLEIAREIGDRRGEGNDLGNLGSAYATLGDPRKAIDFYEQNLVIAREIGDQRGEGNALWNLALQFWKTGDHAQVITRAEAALKIREAIEDPHAAQVRAALAKWRTPPA